MRAAPSHNLVTVVSFPRSGTHLVLDTLRANFTALSKRKLPLQHAHRVLVDLDRLRATRNVPPLELSQRDLSKVSKGKLGKTHSFVSGWAPGGWFSGLMQVTLSSPLFIYVVRDPVKTLASAWVYTKALKDNVPETFLEFAENYPPSELGFLEVDGSDIVSAWANHVRGWTAAGSALVIDFDKLLRSPTSEIERIARHIGRLREGDVVVPEAPNRVRGRILRRLAVRPSSTTVMGPRRPRVSASDAERVRNRALKLAYGLDP